MSEDVKQPPENDPPESDESGENQSTQVVRSSGAQGGTQSPLLASLLKETLLHAEKEKESLDATIRESETQARRAEEKAAAVRRAEIQQKVEEEQQKRRDMLHKRTGASEPVAEAEAPHQAPSRGLGASPVLLGISALLVLGLFGLGYIYMETVKERDLANASQTEVEKKLAALNQRVSATLKEQAGDAGALAVIQTLSDRFEEAVKEKEEAATKIAAQERDEADLIDMLLDQQELGAELKARLKTKTEELTALQLELEEALNVKGRNKGKRGRKTNTKGKKAEVATEPEVKKTDNLFGSERD